ncbi:DUF374 domain-containing protein [Candidatus Kapaibacterium sp.]
MSSMSFKYRLAVQLLNILSKTWRINLTAPFDYKGKGIVVFWHGLMLPCWKQFSSLKPTAVVSLSKDGEILSSLLQKWKYKLIRGSSSQKGKEVLALVEDACKNNLVLMTPDGPQGPAQKMKAGAVIAAMRSNVPLYLCGVNIIKKKVFARAWDKFQLPLPFSLIEIAVSEPIYIEFTEDKDIINKIIIELESKLLYLNKTIQQKAKND